MAHAVRNPGPRKNGKIVLPFDQAEYEQLLISPEAFRKELDSRYQISPELFPPWDGFWLGNERHLPIQENR